MVDTAKVTLVTVVGVFEVEQRLMDDLKRLGVKGFTRGEVDGRGVHGPRMAGLADAPNFRLEMLVRASLAQRILERIAARYAGQPVLAFLHPVEAMPSEHFK
jgi:nitrogen regulatory protein P-II 2